MGPSGRQMGRGTTKTKLSRAIATIERAHPIGKQVPISREKGFLLHSTKEMTFPVLPPTFFKAPPRPWAAFVRAGPADEVTRERPSEAFEAAEEALSLALEAASEEEEACLTAVLRVKNCDCRRTARDAVAGMTEATREKKDGRKGREDEKEVAGGGQSSPMGLGQERRAATSKPQIEI